MDGCEDICAALNDTLACLWHGDRRAGGQKYWLIPRGQWKVTEEVALNQDHLLVAEAHLSSGIS